MTIKTSPILAELRENVALITKSTAEIESLKRDGERWLREKRDIIASGAVSDDRRVAMVGTLDARLSMLPYAIEKATSVRPNIIALIDRRAVEAIDRALAICAHVESEARETLRSNVGLFLSDESEVEDYAGILLGASEVGKRIAIVAGNRVSPPIRGMDGVMTLLNFLTTAEELLAWWSKSKQRFGKTPALVG